MAAISREEAQQFIDNLRIDNGALTEEDIDFLKRERPRVLRALDTVRRKLGASTKTLATNLYAKDTRFVYELTQNAEDNKYTIANVASEPPFLHFCVYQDRIVIDSNEDGFSKANINAICSTGESTKTFSQGYIGEKGIGFKSVFKVARKVHVQSGPFSFSFKYQHGEEEDGLGMVTPMNEDPLDIPNGVRTRMILYLLEQCDRAKLYNEFASLPDTLLLFLKKLKQLSIKISLPGYSQVEQMYSLSSKDNRVSICKRMVNSKSSSTQDYRIIRHQVTNMPNDHARKGINEAEVVLAFPLDRDDVPVLENQHVFAFLPLRKLGFKFLIQSDFITQASREDVFDSEWNNRLLDEVTIAFIYSIRGFLSHPKLKNSWVRYVPKDQIADDFWGQLQNKIMTALSSERVFFSRRESLLPASQLRIVTEEYRDNERQPLLPDLRTGPTEYISEVYDEELDLPVLRKLGTEQLTDYEFLKRLEQDLDQPHPHLYTRDLATTWHTKVANLLIRSLSHHSECVKRLKLVPLDSGNWIRSLNNNIYFPTSGGMEIPKDLPLNLLHPRVLDNTSRKNLFVRLGATECKPPTVFPLISKRYRSYGVTLEQSLSHIKFMFWHQTELPSGKIDLRLAPKGDDQYFSPHDPHNGWTYCPQSTQSCAMSKIFDTVPKKLKNHVRFLNPVYYDELKKLGRRNDLDGQEWLRKIFDIKQLPQILQRVSRRDPSYEVEYIRQNRPEFLLGVLEANYHVFREDDPWDELFKSTRVPIQDSGTLMKLDYTHLPLPGLKKIVNNLGLGKGFGFLKEVGDITDSTAAKWRFLKRFGVGVEEDQAFWLALLEQARIKNNVPDRAVFEIYANLQRFVRDEEIKKLKNAFKKDFIYIPSVDGEPASWNYLNSCVWNSKEWFTFRTRLGAFEPYKKLAGLFKSVLGLRDADYDNYLEYLQHIKSSRSYLTPEERVKIPRLYEEMAKESTDSAKSKNIRADFMEDELIYNPKHQSWHSLLSCIWAEHHIQLPGKYSIATDYKELMSFFVKALQVAKPNLKMHVLALIEKTSENPNKRDIIQEMLNICAFDLTPQTLEDLSECKCLPVKRPSGELRWQNKSGSFAIVDRRDYGEIFGGKVNFLDFSLEEVHSLNSLLVGLGLEGRYTSKAVREITTVQGGSLNRRLTTDLRKKAYAICRYAAHLRAREVQNDLAACYSTLQNVNVYTSDGISKSVSIRQHGNSVTVPQETAYFHLQVDDGKLNLYVPKRKQRRQVCLNRQLPIDLLRHFGVPKSAPAGELGPIITASHLSIVDELLELAGIIELDGIERPEDENKYESSSSETEEIPDSIAQTPLTPQSVGSISPDALSVSSVGGGSILTPALSFTSRSPKTSERPDLYKRLLNAVVLHAHNISDLPRVGNTIAASISSSWDFDLSLAVASPFANEKEVKIGAAGEFFVYQLLKRLNLPGFDINNWQSTIRDRVALHEHYQDITTYPGHETADIVYNDQRSALTGLLIERGYLRSALWSGRSPKYYIEVKTTTGPQDTPFYCSQNQYEMMESMRLDETNSFNEIYLIARVFSLGNWGMGLKLYLDPAVLRKERKLEFRADKYTVTPLS